MVACRKTEDFKDKPLSVSNSLIIAHRGGGNGIRPDNHINSIKQTLPDAMGVEVDIQISKDKTIWLSHSEKVLEGEKEIGCFASTKDSEIEKIKYEDGITPAYTKLEDVLNYMHQNYPEKYISLDTKAWSPCSLGGLNINGMLKLEAEQIIKLAAKYSMSDQIMVESQTATMLEYIKEHDPKIAVYLSSWGDLSKAIQRALKSKFTGVSFKIHSTETVTSESIQLMHRKGLKIQLWTLSNGEIENFTPMHPDFVQVDIP